MKQFLRWLTFTIGCAAALAATAAEVTFYEGDGFRGRAFSAFQTINDFATTGFNDRASSLVVRSGSWQLCTDANFGGRCVTLNPGDYSSLRSMGLENRISSARPVGGGRIALYEAPNFGGRSYALEDDTRNFDPIGINDRASSVIVYDGTWELCEHADYGGQCIILAPGRHADLGRMANRASSARMTTARPPGGGGPGGRAGAVLFERPNLSGRSFVLDNEVVANFDNFGFNDRASSLRVDGGFWVFCSDANFQGECRTFGPGEYPQLPWDLNNRISSGRRISGHNPYSGSPNWNAR